MAFAGLNVTFGFIQASAPSGQQITAIAPIYGPSTASQTMAAAATSTVSAASGKSLALVPMASIYAAADSWVTIGQNPPDPAVDQPVGGRRFIPATTPIDIFCSPGDKVRWSAA